MLQEITIKNFKSIADDTIELGRVNVFIGENGCGKSNILEAVGFASASIISSHIDKEILMNKGVRIAKPSLMVSAFKKKQNPEINMDLKFDKDTLSIKTKSDNDDIHLAKWLGNNTTFYEVLSKDLFNNKKIQEAIYANKEFVKASLGLDKARLEKIIELNIKEIFPKIMQERIESGQIDLPNEMKQNHEIYLELSGYVIYALNTPALRGFTRESGKAPVGIYGERLDELLESLDKNDVNELKEYNYLIDWLQKFNIDKDDSLKFQGYKLNQSKSKLYFSDKYIKNADRFFSSENANEGILHVLFYLAVMISKQTPKFFAIDNIESSLNPHLCRHLMTEICKLAKKHEKQLLITTHNPAILDGLNLFDDEIRLFEVKRLDNGHTKTRRIKLKPDVKNEVTGETYKLSELWTRGYLGAISKQF